jgi:tRNA 2-selenouridine synthase
VIITIDDFLKLRKELPAVDVRSEGEFQAGHIRDAVNIPILNNTERVQVGTDYKTRGQLEAIKTGFRLVGPRIIDIVNEAEAVASGRELLVHCWRGGMRSSNFCQFVGMARVKTHQLEGGYKAYRSAAIQSFHKPIKFRIIGGYTGSGKTEILESLARRGEQVLDLESLASHKGSVFGGLMMPPQPTTEQFQNDLFEQIQKLDLSRPVWVEDESITIGSIVIPVAIWQKMISSPVYELSVSRKDRVTRLVKDYGKSDKQEFLKAMTRIVKKLGGQHFNAAKEKLEADDMAATIEILLTYYDKAYQTGLSKKHQRIRATINWEEDSADDVAAKLVESSNN